MAKRCQVCFNLLHLCICNDDVNSVEHNHPGATACICGGKIRLVRRSGEPDG